MSMILVWEQELHESWQARVYMRVFSTFIAWSNENKSCMRVDKREFTWEFSQLSLLDQREQELHESWQARVYMRVFSTFIAWSNENKSCMRVDKREFTWEFSDLSLLDQTRSRVAWELTSESLHESFLNFHCLIKQEQELHESWQVILFFWSQKAISQRRNLDRLRIFNSIFRNKRESFLWQKSKLLWGFGVRSPRQQLLITCRQQARNFSRIVLLGWRSQTTHIRKTRFDINHIMKTNNFVTKFNFVWINSCDNKLLFCLHWDEFFCSL